MKPKFPAALAKEVVRELLPQLSAACIQDQEGKPWLRVAGSLRRRKAEVGDIEFVYCAKWGPVKKGLFQEEANLANELLADLIAQRVIEPRLNTKGQTMWGTKNKLAVHVRTGIPVDFFAIEKPHFWNYLVCRTGSAENNIRLATSAQARGLQWHPYNGSFSVLDADKARAALNRDDLHTGSLVLAKSEQEVFTLCGLPYLEPWDR